MYQEVDIGNIQPLNEAEIQEIDNKVGFLSKQIKVLTENYLNYKISGI